VVVAGACRGAAAARGANRERFLTL
jgi:hypothetical protein